MPSSLYDYLMEYAQNNSAEVLQGCGCEGGCSHPSGRCPAPTEGQCYCSGNCCFNEIYYPENRENSRLKYNCKKLVNQYVFRSLDRYASEIVYALNECDSILEDYANYDLLSLGCGPSTEFVAIDYYNKQKENLKTINYYGIDIEKTWKEVHKEIKKVVQEDASIESFAGRYGDILEILNSDILENKTFNIIVLNYVISSFIADGNRDKILIMFESISNLLKNKNIQNCIIIINDVNYPLRGIDLFEKILEQLEEKNIRIFSQKKKYFQYSTYVTPYGEKYERILTFFGHPVFKQNKCTSAQLLINCGVSNDY